MRHNTPLALALLAGLLMAAPVLAQDSSDSARKSFAQRLASLRLGWGDDEPEKPSPRSAVKASPRQQAGDEKSPESSGYSLMSRLPRLNPGDLLPGDMFSGRETSDDTRRTTAQLRQGKPSYRRADAATGSARARIMRDLRSQTADQSASAPRVASLPTQTAPNTPAARSTTAANTSRSANPPVPRTSSTQTASPVVLQRGSTARAGSVLSASMDDASPDRPAEARPTAISESQLRRELLGPLDLSPSNDRARQADEKTTKSVAAAVANSMKEAAPAEAEGDEIAEILKAATSQPVAQEVTARPEPNRPPIARSTNSDPPPPTAATPPSPVVAADALEESVAAESFEQEVAKRKFAEEVEQTVAPRTAPADDQWEVAEVSRSSAREQAAPTHSSSDYELLISQRMPQIASRVSGPRQIVIGREAVYRVTLANRGEEAADQLITQINVPEWAEVMGSTASTGLVDPPRSEGDGTVVLWRMPELRPGATQSLDLRIVARQGRPIELGVHWKHAAVGARAVVEVQEPKLRLTLDGPGEVLFGKPQKYRLTLANPGTGAAENVTVQLTPPGTAGRVASSHTIGSLRSGESRTIEFEFTAQEAGQLRLLASAGGLGDLSASVEKDILCRKPELEVDWRGPNEKYAGAAATYYFRVRNPGTATAEGVALRLALPTGFKFAKASGNGSADATGRQVVWQVGDLRPGDDYFMELQGAVHHAGANRFKLSAADREGLASSTVVATTEVITVADLKLEIGDPKGPLPVGRDAIYEVRVRNRGSSAAENVNILGLFSAGIEPYRVEGAEANIADGRVAIRAIDRLTVGSELVVKIHARANKPGTHIFRAEVLCRDLDIKLAAEETTRFYTEEPIEVGEASGFGRR